MNGTDWLRSLIKRKPKYATGGYIAGPGTGDMPLAPIGQGGCVFPLPATPPANSHFELREPTEAEAEEFAQQLTKAIVAPRVRPSREHTEAITKQATERARQQRIEMNGCTCAYIYSRCYCQAQTAAQH